MAFTNHFYHRLTRKYVTVFGSLFNKYTIKRYGKNGEVLQTIPVPISYGPWQKFLARLQSDPNLNRKYQISLPRMSFELENITYDNDRRSSLLNRINVIDENGKNFVYNPVPYIINFTLHILVEHTEDGSQLMEQIVPYFQPGFTPSVYLIEGLDQSIDIPIDLTGVSYEDVYDDAYETSRFMKWTLSFQMKAFFFGPLRNGKVIKFVDVKTTVQERRNGEDHSYLGSLITVQPGMDANGNPTKDIDQTIEYEEINVEDDWETLTQIHGFDELLELDLIDKDPNPHENNGKL